jgi:hypothetical protein
MSMAKLFVITCFTVFALSAVVSTTAFAGGQWDINGTPLAAHATVGLENPLVLNPGLLLVTAGVEAFTIKCTGHEILLKKGVLIGPDGALAESVIFHECKVVTPGSFCQLNGSLITTLPIHGLAHLDGTLNALLLVLPETKTVLATIRLTGEFCPIEGIQALTGGVEALIHEAIHPTRVKLALAFSLKGQLKLGVSEAELAELHVDLKLTSGLPWSFL